MGQREPADLDDRIDSVEDKLLEDIESNAAKMEEQISQLTKEQTEENRMLAEMVNQNERKLTEVEAKLVEQEELLKKNVPDIKCDECGKSFLRKIDRKKTYQSAASKTIQL